MITFVVLASMLTIVGVALIVVPLLKRSRVEASPAPWAALVAAGVLVFGSVLVYVATSNFSWRAAPADDSPQNMVARLARKLEREPNDLNGWLMLGRSYTVLEQYPLALRAFQRADRLAGGRSAEALVGEAETLALTDETELDRQAGRLVEQALAIDPNSGKALFFGAAAALRRGELPLARDRFAKLLALDPPANIKPLLQKQIEAIDRRLAGLPDEIPAAGDSGAAQNSAAGSGPPNAGNGQPNTRPGQSNASEAPSNAKVRINVSLAPKLAQAAQGTWPLFVFVRDPRQPGPPLAVKRLENHFPQTVELSAADSMLPGRTLTAGQQVQV